MNTTIYFNNSPSIIGVSSIGGPKESNSFIGKYIETKLKDDFFGVESFEKAEIKMLYTTVMNAIKNAGKNNDEIDCFFAGDLLNQIISATFTARNLDFSFLGLYNACATFVEALLISSTFIDGPTPSLDNMHAPAPVTVHCACGGLVEPSSNG